MAHILCMTTGLTGILNASFEVVRRLEGWGHRVTYASPWDVADAVRRQGITYEQLRAVDFCPAPLPEHPDGVPAGVISAWATASTRRRDGLERLGMDEFAEVLRGLRPDLVVSDAELLEHVITAVAMKTPVALLSQFFSFWKRPGMPPVHREMTPDAGRLRMGLAWRQLWWRRRREVLLDRLRTGGTDRRSILRAYARQAGFPAREIDVTGYLAPFGFRSLPTLHMTAREIEFPHDPKSNVQFVGPMVAAERRDPAPPDLADVVRLERTIDEAKRGGQRIVYCSMSSKDAGDLAFVERLIEAVESEAKWTLIVALGGQIDSAALAGGTPNAHVFGWVPQLEVLPHADCSVNHGGIHTIHECLHFRVPMVAYSGKRYDQNGAAARVQYHGIGLADDKDRASVDEIRGAIRRVLTEVAFRERVDRMQQAIATYREEHRLERAVDDLLDPARSGDRPSA